MVAFPHRLPSSLCHSRNFDLDPQCLQCESAAVKLDSDTPSETMGLDIGQEHAAIYITRRLCISFGDPGSRPNMSMGR
jgi:hypothetical protein